MGRASEGKKTQKAAKYGNKRSSNGKQKDKGENPSKRQRAADDAPEQPKKVGKLDELTDVSSFFDAVEEGVDFSEPSHSTYKPGEDDSDDAEADADSGSDDEAAADSSAVSRALFPPISVFPCAVFPAGLFLPRHLRLRLPERAWSARLHQPLLKQSVYLCATAGDGGGRRVGRLRR